MHSTLRFWVMPVVCLVALFSCGDEDNPQVDEDAQPVVCQPEVQECPQFILGGDRLEFRDPVDQLMYGNKLAADNPDELYFFAIFSYERGPLTIRGEVPDAERWSLEVDCEEDGVRTNYVWNRSNTRILDRRFELTLSRERPDESWLAQWGEDNWLDPGAHPNGKALFRVYAYLNQTHPTRLTLEEIPSIPEINHQPNEISQRVGPAEGVNCGRCERFLENTAAVMEVMLNAQTEINVITDFNLQEGYNFFSALDIYYYGTIYDTRAGDLAITGTSPSFVDANVDYWSFTLYDLAFMLQSLDFDERQTFLPHRDIEVSDDGTYTITITHHPTTEHGSQYLDAVVKQLTTKVRRTVSVSVDG